MVARLVVLVVLLVPQVVPENIPDPHRCSKVLKFAFNGLKRYD